MTTQKGKESSDEAPVTSELSTVQGQNALRLKVAELAGKVAVFEFQTGTAHEFLQILPKDRPWIERHGGKMVAWTRASEVADLSDVPDYPSDLNACHELELTLEDDPGRDAKYWETLYRLLDDDDEGNPIDGPPNGHWCDLKKVGHATAEQRCRAFVALHEGKEK